MDTIERQKQDLEKITTYKKNINDLSQEIKRLKIELEDQMKNNNIDKVNLLTKLMKEAELKLIKMKEELEKNTKVKWEKITQI